MMPKNLGILILLLHLSETQQVVQLVREHNARVQIGFMRRFDPGYALAKAKIEAGELGKLETFRALSRDTYPPTDWQGRKKIDFRTPKHQNPQTS